MAEVKDTYVADVSRYSGPLREAAQDADRFGDKNDKAALAARKMGLAAKEAAEKAARAQRQAAEAAEKLAKGEIEADEAAQAEAKALREVERASIKAAEAQRAAGKAADQAADNMRQAARAAALSAAAERLGALKAAGAVEQHNALLRQLKAEHGDLSKTAVAGFKMMEKQGGLAYGVLEKGSAKLGEANKLGLVAVVNTIALLPELASVAAGAITLGLGGAIAGVGILMAAKNKQIRDEYSALGKEVFGHLQADAQPFIGVLEHIGQYAEDEFRSWDPLVKSAFADMAPTIDRFARQGIDSLEEFKPAFQSIVKGFDAELGALGNRLGGISHNIATGIKAIGDAAARNPEALASLANDLSLFVRYGGDAIAFLVRFKSQFDQFIGLVAGPGPAGLFHLIDGFTKLKNLGGGGSLFGQVAKSLQGTSGSADSASKAMTSTGMATEKLLTAEQAAALGADQLKTALDRLTGANQSAFDAQTNYANALSAANEQAKKSNAGFDGMSKAVQANREALSNLAQSFKANLTGKTPEQIEAMRKKFISVAEGMGASKQRAKELADQLLGVSGNMKQIPDKKDTKLGATDNTGTGVGSAKKSTESFAHRAYRAQLTAVSRVAGVVHTAISLAASYANRGYRAQLTAVNRAGGVISGAISAAAGYAHRTYRASLTAVNNAWSALSSALAAGRSWAGRVFTATFNVVKHLFHAGGPVGYADGGAVQGYPTGGSVSGPGTSTSDSIPAMLSNGEYVINAKQAAKWRGLLDSINYGVNGFAEGGFIEGYAKGGKAKKPTKAQLAHAAATRARAMARPEELAALAAQHSLAAMRSSMMGGVFRGGRPGIGSSGSTVVQHVTMINVNVAGSIRSDQDLAKVIQRQLITNRMPVSLPAGR